MHLIKDENGNPIHHGHEHTHEHTHENGVTHSHAHSHEAGESHEHTHEDGHEHTNETVAVLTYMLEHNEHHAAELAEMARELEMKGMAEAAKKIQDGVMNFRKGTADLNEALNIVKEKNC